MYRKKEKGKGFKRQKKWPKNRMTDRLAFKSPQSFGKAYKKTAKALPHSPRKKRAVICKVATEAGLVLTETSNKNQKDNLLDSVHKTVEEFFVRPDVVYTCPGLKDEVTVWKNGQKLKLRKYFLTMFLTEAFALFQECHPDITLGFSTFSKMCPDNVLLLHQTPADQCKCLICENFFLKLNTLRMSYDSSAFWRDSLCDDSANSDCWNGECNSCSNGLWVPFPNENLEKEVSWKLWDKNENKKLQCTIRMGCVGELQSQFKEDFSKVVQHINVKRIQAEEFSKDKTTDNVRILQMDFAMGYSCEFQGEVQSALWSRGSVTLFTAAVMHKGVTKTYLICSDTKDKEKNTVSAFIKYLYANELDPNSPEMLEIEEVMWTDGPSSEFKNRFMVCLLQQLCRKYQKPFSWKYSATSHGKGVVDGIGGRAKSLVRTAVMSKGESAPIVQNAKDFFQVVEKLMPSTKVILIENNPRDDRVWENAVPIPGIKKFHVLKCLPGERIQFFHNAKAPVIQEKESVQAECVHDLQSDVRAGDWVLVQYESATYPGEVENVIGSEYAVNVMVKAGVNTWKWPSSADRLRYNLTCVKKRIRPPEVVSSRGQFIFPDLRDM